MHQPLTVKTLKERERERGGGGGGGWGGVQVQPSRLNGDAAYLLAAVPIVNNSTYVSSVAT